jgi:hypothetical protein
VKFEFERESNSNLDSNPYSNLFVLKGKGQLGAVGRFFLFHACSRPSPRPDLAQLNPHRSPFLTISFTRWRVDPACQPYLFPLISLTRAGQLSQARSAAGPTAPARAGWRARPSRPAGTHAKVRRVHANPEATTGKGFDPAAPFPPSIRGGRSITAGATWPGTAASQGHRGAFPLGTPRHGFKRRGGR